MEPNNVLKQAKQALEEAIAHKKATKELLQVLGPAIVEILRPVLDEVADNAKVSKEDFLNAVAQISVNPNIEVPTPNIEVNVPEVKLPVINVPEPKVTVNVPEIKLPEIKVPKAEVTVKVPKIEVPKIKIPDVVMPEEMNIRGWVQLMGVDLNNPLPVQLRDAKGNPVNLFENLTQIIGGGGGGKADFFTIKDIRASSVSIIDQDTGALKVTMSSSATGGLTDAELRASSVPVSQVSGATYSVNVVDAFGSTAVTSVFNADNRLRVSVETGGSGLTDSELRASSVPVSQVSGANWSVYVTDVFGSTGTNVINPDGRLKVELPTGSSSLTDSELRAASVPVSQVSGAAWTVYVKEIFNSAATDIVNPDGRLKVELPTGSSGLTDSELRATSVPVEQVSGSTWSTNVVSSALPSGAATLAEQQTQTASLSVLDDWDESDRAKVNIISGVAGVAANQGDTDSRTIRVVIAGDSAVSTAATIQGTPTVTVSGSITSTVVTGTTASDAVDDNSAPVKMGGIARTANPSAVSGGDTVSFSSDNLGRQLVRPVQARGLIATAFVALTNGTETTLLAAGGTGVFHDCISIMASNNSSVAVTLDVRSVTAGNVEFTIEVPANSPGGIAFSVPWPQGNANNNWTIDMPDITGTTVNVSALFTKEV